MEAGGGPTPAHAGRTGRRPGKPDTRAHILQVAGEVFRRDGFAVASMSRDEVVRVYAPLVQHFIADDLGVRGARRKSSPDASRVP